MNDPRRMSGLDALFLSLELPAQPMQCMTVAVLRPAEDDGERPIPISLDDVRRHVACRLDALPAFRLCVKPVPFGLHHPVFVEAPDFDLDHHLGRAALPAPGGPHELDRLYASLAASCLDRRYPLWRLTLVDGLHGGRQALILEVHHSLMDGTALLTAFSRLFSGKDDQRIGPASGSHLKRPPGRWRLILDAMTDHWWGLARLPALVRKTTRGAAAIRARSAGSTIAVRRPGADSPPCSLNVGFTSERRFARASLSLTDIKLVKDVAGVTVNDVVLSVVAGALRDYLELRQDLPDQPLVANVPVGMEASGDIPRAVGNSFTRLVTSLATNVADPWARLLTISAVTRESKRCVDLMGREVLSEWLNLIPPAIVRAVVQHGHRRRRHHPDHLDTNVTVSNVRGPTQPWSFGSAVVEAMYISGPPSIGVGVTFVVWDYAGTLLVGILSFADSVETPAELASGLSRSLSELVTVARCRRAKSAALASGLASGAFPVTGQATGAEGVRATRFAAAGSGVTVPAFSSAAGSNSRTGEAR
jgi:WS/DGAT/MGAT family acyltransferase